MMPFRGIAPRRRLDISRGSQDADIYFGAMAVKVLRDSGVFSLAATETNLMRARQMVGRLERELIDFGALRLGELTWSIELKGAALDIQVYRSDRNKSPDTDLWIS